MTKTQIASLVAPVVGAAFAVAGHFLAPALMAEIMFWTGTVGGALVGVANLYASPPAKKAPLVPPGMNALFLGISLTMIAAGGVAGCSALAPAVGPSSEAATCVIVNALEGQSITQIVSDCKDVFAGLTEAMVADILNGLLAKDLAAPPDAGMAMAPHALTPLQRATLSVTLNAYNNPTGVH